MREQTQRRPSGGIAGGARCGGSGTTYGSATTSERDSRQLDQRVDVRREEERGFAEGLGCDRTRRGGHITAGLTSNATVLRARYRSCPRTREYGTGHRSRLPIRSAAFERKPHFILLANENLAHPRRRGEGPARGTDGGAGAATGAAFWIIKQRLGAGQGARRPLAMVPRAAARAAAGDCGSPASRICTKSHLSSMSPCSLTSTKYLPLQPRCPPFKPWFEV